MKQRTSYIILAYLILATGICTYYFLSIRVAPEDWTLHPTLGVPREGAESVVYDKKMYVFSGFENINHLTVTGRVEVYDSVTKTWELKEEIMPIPVTHVGAALVEDKVWFAGGYAGSGHAMPTDAVQIYDIDSDSWSMGPKLPRRMGSSELVHVDGKLYTFGGTQEDRQTNIDDHFVLDLANQEEGWQQAAPMPMARTHFAAVALDGIIYAIGGEFGHDVLAEDVPYVHAYDPKTDTWERKADLPFSRSHFEQSTLTHGGKIIIIGGKSYKELAVPNITEYNPKTNRWSELAPLPYAIMSPAAQIINDKMLVLYGGRNSYKYIQDTFWQKYFPYTYHGHLHGEGS